MVIIYLYYIEFFLYVCIGAAQISSMGDLAIQLSGSVSGLFQRDESRFDRCMGKIPPRY